MSAPPPQIEADVGAAGRAQLEFDDNLLLPALYGERDQHLDRIERQLGVSLIPRGNRLSIAGPASATEVARLVLTRLYDRLKRGQDIDTASVDAAIRLAQAEIEDKSLSLWRDDTGFRTRKRRIAPRSAAQAHYVKAMREHELVFGLGPGRHRQNLSRRRRGDRSADGRQGRADHPVAPGGRGRRAARLSARRSAREGRPVSAADLRRAERHAAGRPACEAAGQRRDRGGADRLHARPHAGARLRDPRRGAEHDAGADEDVPDPARRGLAHGRDRRPDAGRPAARHPLRPRRRAGGAARRRGYRRSSGSPRRTSCATGWSRASSAPTRRATAPPRGDEEQG